MRILYLSLLLCVAQAFIPSFLADTTTRDAENNPALERSETDPPVEQQINTLTSPALTSDHLPRHEPQDRDITAVHENAGESDSHEPPGNRQGHIITRRDVVAYIAVVKDDYDIEKFRDFLKTKAEDGNDIYQIGPDNKILGYGNVTLTPSSKADVEKYEGTLGLLDDLPVTFHRAVPTKSASLEVHPSAYPYENSGKLSRRALKWKAQYPADEALVMDSEYDGGTQTLDFVYPENPGQGIYVYVIEWGIQIRVRNPDDEREFKTDNDRVLQTTRSLQRHASPDTDDNTVKPSHGTQVASKAVGKKYGLAKEATLVSTKVMPISGDWENAMWLIVEDIKRNDRAAKSVVTTSMALGKGMTAEEAKNNKQSQKLYGNHLRELSNLGVPFVASAGNDATDPNRKLVDQLPMLLSGDDIPLIIVGASDYDGKQGDFSQAGPLVTIHAPGVDVECQTKENGESATVSGASIAAPQVAGLIATYLSYETKPWDDTKTGVERVKAIRDYLTSEKSSWVRDRDDPNGGIRVIWNGADAAAHGDDDDDGDDESPDDSGPPPSSPAPPPKPSRKNKALSIIYQNYIDDISNENTWLFFNSDYGESSECRLDTQAMKTVPADGNVDNPPWPAGTYEMGNLIDSSSCDYLNDGTNPGSLWCQDWDAPPTKQGEPALPKDREIKCKAEEVRYKSGAEGCSESMMGIYRHAVVTCDW